MPCGLAPYVTYLPLITRFSSPQPAYHLPLDKSGFRGAERRFEEVQKYWLLDWFVLENAKLLLGRKRLENYEPTMSFSRKNFDLISLSGSYCLGAKRGLLKLELGLV